MRGALFLLLLAFFSFFLRLSLLAKAFGAECEYFLCSALQSSQGIDTGQRNVRLR